MSGTTAADLERDGGGFLRGLERESAVQASLAPGEASPIPKMRRRRIVFCDRGSVAQCADTMTKGMMKMTYEEEMAEQKAKYIRLAGMLDRIQHGFSGPDIHWDIPYPVRSGSGKWGRMWASRYKGTTGFGFQSGAQAHVNPKTGEFGLDLDHVWFLRKDALAAPDDVVAWIQQILKDPAKANRRIAVEFPLEERMGVVPRFVVERYVPKAYSIGKALGTAKSRQFVKIFDSGYFWSKENCQTEDMTANRFFEYCRIAYIAAEEKEDHLDRKMSGRDMYARYSDGRYGALLDIDPDSPEQFMDWLDHKIPCDKRGGDHPWEIKRGGNTTHIDLRVSRVRDYGWYANEEERKKAAESRTVEVVLCGQHIGRIVETVKMFLALHHAGLPIWICDAESVRNRILGLDHFGIMPDSGSLHRGRQEFPEDFHIEDVMHLRSFGRARRAALPFISWKPLPVLLPK